MSPAAQLRRHHPRMHAPTRYCARALKRTRCNGWVWHSIRAAAPAPNPSAAPAFSCGLLALPAPLVHLPL